MLVSSCDLFCSNPSSLLSHIAFFLSSHTLPFSSPLLSHIAFLLLAAVEEEGDEEKEEITAANETDAFFQHMELQ